MKMRKALPVFPSLPRFSTPGPLTWLEYVNLQNQSFPLSAPPGSWQEVFSATISHSDLLASCAWTELISTQCFYALSLAPEHPVNEGQACLHP